MAWTKADVPQVERDLLAADVPCLVGRNWARATLPGWPRWTTDGNNGSADQAATDFDSFFAKDDYDHIPTKPNTAAVTWYFNLDLGSEQGVIDSFALLGHNFGTIGSVNYDLQIADDAAFTVRLATIVSDVAPSNKRLVHFDIKEFSDPNAQRFTGVRYCRLRFAKGTTFTPEFSEVFVGRRRQLFEKPTLPFDPLHLVSSVRLAESDNGIAGGSVRYQSRRIVDYSYITRDATAIADLTTFATTETDGLTLPFMFAEKPSSAPSDALFMRWQGDEPEFVGPTQTLDERRFELHAIEHGKNLIAQGI